MGSISVQLFKVLTVNLDFGCLGFAVSEAIGQ